MPSTQGFSVVKQGTKPRDPALVELTFWRGRHVDSVIKSCLTLLPHSPAHQPPQSMGFPREENWSGLPSLTQGWNLHLLHWQVDYLPLSHLGSPSSMERQTNQQVKYLVMNRKKEAGEEVF